MKILCENFKSLSIALVFSIAVLALWFGLMARFEIGVILLAILAIFGIIAITAEWRIGSFGAKDLSGFPFQTSPIAAASLLAGWSSVAMLKDFHQENAILLVATASFCLHSIFAYTESAYPDKGGKRGNYRKRDKFGLSVNLVIVHGFLCAFIGHSAASEFYKYYPQQESACRACIQFSEGQVR